MRKLIFLPLIIIGLVMLAGPALAQEPDFDRINEIAKELNCPTCAGINLADCRTLTCEQWREKIGELVAQGYTDQEVLDYFSTRYGTQVLQEPPRSGFTLVLWVLPVIALLAGGWWLVYTIRGWAQQKQPAVEAAAVPAAETAAPPAGALSEDDYLDEVEKDLNLE